MGLVWWGLSGWAHDLGGQSWVFDGQGAQRPPWCVLAETASISQAAAIQQIPASSFIFKRQSVNGCLTQVGNVTCFLTICWLGMWALWGVLPAGLLKESNYLCVLWSCSQSEAVDKRVVVALCLPVIPVYFTGSLRRFMVISLLLEQVQQHENEYVVTLINPSTRSFRTALIILHPTKAWQYRFRDYTPGLGCCSMELWHTVTAPDTARRVEDL